MSSKVWFGRVKSGYARCGRIYKKEEKKE